MTVQYHMPVSGAQARPTLGDPAPRFSAKTIFGAGIDLHVDAGRYVVLSFMGHPADPKDVFDPKLGQFMRHAPLFKDDHIVFYGIVESRPADGSMYWLINRPALTFLADYDRALAALYNVEGISCTIVLDPMLRVIAFVPFDHPDGHVNIIGDLLRSLPPPSDHVGMDLTAPVLIVPRVFEFELCDYLIKYLRQAGGEDSGFLLDQNGVSRTLVDYKLKRRVDCAIADPQLKQELRDRILRRLVPAITEAFSFTPTRMDRFLLAKYSGETNDHFFRHRDNSNAAAAHRRFALTINLNGEAGSYEGGDLRFPEFGAKTYRVPSGAAIVFSCGLLHEVTPMQSGERFAYLAFLYGEDDARRRLAANANIADGEWRYDGNDDLLSPANPASPQNSTAAS
jgi:predicted 2-oxoglutarate/Fe(II)-dependent dioxygenase YbiX/peroxiredoxin